jgi:hypothetical protein
MNSLAHKLSIVFIEVGSAGTMSLIFTPKCVGYLKSPLLLSISKLKTRDVGATYYVAPTQTPEFFPVIVLKDIGFNQNTQRKSALYSIDDR